MKATYHAEADILDVQFNDNMQQDAQNFDDRFIIYFDKNDEICGLELIDIKKFIDEHDYEKKEKKV